MHPGKVATRRRNTDGEEKGFPYRCHGNDGGRGTTPNLVLKGGHWCPKCAPPGWNYDEEVRRNPFFAQVWYPNHDKEENNVYPQHCWKDILHA